MRDSLILPEAGRSGPSLPPDGPGRMARDPATALDGPLPELTGVELWAPPWVDTVMGTDRNDRLHGNDNLRFLVGGGGDDVIYGGTGFEYIEGNDGNDILYSGDGWRDTVWGGAGDDILVCGSGWDNMFGGDGDDIIIGSEGTNDRLSGGSGNDIYWRVKSWDLVDERTGGGTDIVYTAYDYSLPGNVEHLVLLDQARRGTGNDSNNAITGNSADNLLQGMGGNDALFGGGGKDRLEGGSGKDRLYGGYGQDELDGGAGDDWLEGGQGYDVLTGGTGADIFAFGIGAYRLGENGTVLGRTIQQDADRVTDFRASEGDRIALSLGTFRALADAGLKPGDPLKAKFFVNGAWATDSDDYLLYDGKTGELWYDESGSGSVVDVADDGVTRFEWSGKRLVASFDLADGKYPALGAGDFILIA